MAFTRRKGLYINNSNIRFYGEQYYGSCTTSSTTQTKTVSIANFSNEDLIDGTRVTVFFHAAQSYNGTPKLNVSSTGAKSIYTSTSAAGYGEWTSQQMVSFVYYGGAWYIEDGAHANASLFGKTKLNSSVGTDSTTAITPYAVMNALSYIVDNPYEGNGAGVNIVNTTLPNISGWTFDGDFYRYSISNVIINNIDGDVTKPRIIKIKYGDSIYYHNLLLYRYYFGEYITLAGVYGETDLLTIAYDNDNDTISITATQSMAGAYPFVVDYFSGEAAGIITAPYFLDTVGDIETLLASI